MRANIIFSLICLFSCINSAIPCAHNIDPNGLTTFGYSQFTGKGYKRIEFLAGKSIPGKKAVKIYFVEKLAKSKLKYIDLAKRPYINKKLNDIREYALSIPSWNTRGGMNLAKAKVAGKEVEFKGYYSRDNAKIEDIMSDMETRFDFKFDPSHKMDEKLELGHRTRELKTSGYDNWAGRDILVVSVKDVSDASESQGIALQITSPVFERYKESHYFVEITRLKMLELNMSSVGHWAFKVEGSGEPIIKRDGNVTYTTRGVFPKYHKLLNRRNEHWYYVFKRSNPRDLGIFFDGFYNVTLPYQRLAVDKEKELTIYAFPYSKEQSEWEISREDVGLIFYRPEVEDK